VTVILLPGTLGSSSVLTSLSTSLIPRRVRWSATCALSARNHVQAASAPTNTKAAPAPIDLIFLNEMLIVVSFQLKKLLSARHLRQGNGIHSVNDLSIYVEVFLRRHDGVPDFFTVIIKPSFRENPLRSLDMSDVTLDSWPSAGRH